MPTESPRTQRRSRGSSCTCSCPIPNCKRTRRSGNRFKNKPERRRDMTVAQTQGETRMTSRTNLKIKIFADGDNAEEMVHAYQNKWVDEFTTNPSLMRKAGV